MSITTYNKKKKPKTSTCFICGRSFDAGYDGIIAEGARYGIRFCQTCGLGKTDPFLTEEEFKKIYSSTYREEDSTRFFSPLEKVIRLLRVHRCRSVERFGKKGRILDVGCGRGDFLLLMKERGWEPTGLELDERIERHGKKIGIDLRSGSLETVRFPDSHFEAVTFWHVFEHLKNPEWALKECRRILKPGGLFVISVPNIGSLQARLSGKHWFHLDPPFHLYHYSLENLNKLLDRASFKTLKVKHFSLEYNPYGYIQSIFNSIGFRPNLFYDFLRSKMTKKDSYASVAVMFLLMPVVLPLSLILSVTEAALRAGGTIDLYARKEG
ncbi:MAG: class I SAM-dependent methyltransferase [Deltaproteobacteria bacterium]|nr:class I SAM-dependent methyltransferase [Deltaproteobacteria bacterium]